MNNRKNFNIKEFSELINKCVSLKSSKEVLDLAHELGGSENYYDMDWQGQVAHSSYIAKKRGELWAAGCTDEEIREWEEEMRMQDKEDLRRHDLGEYEE